MSGFWDQAQSQFGFSFPTLCPSILSADFLNLEKELNELSVLSQNWIHLDVMDGHFVPNFTFGNHVISQIRKKTQGFLDAHLMVDYPEKRLQDFLRAGCDLVTLHVESPGQVFNLIPEIKNANRGVGLSIKPKTSVQEVIPYLDQIDLVLVMSVEPGFGGQKFQPEVLSKVHSLVSLRRERKLQFKIQIDGGIHLGTARAAREAGVDAFVAGNAIFGQADRKKAVEELCQKIK